MARQFASGDNGSNASPVLTAAPLTLAVWFKQASNAAGRFISLDNGTANEQLLLDITAGGTVRFVTVAGGTSRAATATLTYTAGGWALAVGVTAVANSRAAYLNGANKGTNINSSTPSGVSTTRVGIGPAAGSPFVGGMAHAAVWNVALTDTEIARLGEGHSPFSVRPAALVAYWKLPGTASPEPDSVGSFPLTLSGTTQAGTDPTILPPPSGSVSAQSSASAILTATGALAGSAAAQSAASAALTGSGAVAGAAAAQSVAAAALTGEGALAGAAAASSLADATLTGAGAVAAVVGAQSSTGAGLTGLGALAAAAAAQSSASCTLTVLTALGAVAGAAAAQSSAAAALTGDGVLAGAAVASSLADATVVGLGALAGSAGASSLAEATVSGLGALAAQVLAQSSASADLVNAGPPPEFEGVAAFSFAGRGDRRDFQQRGSPPAPFRSGSRRVFE